MSHKKAKRCRKMLRARGVDWRDADYRYRIDGSGFGVLHVATNYLQSYCGLARYKELKQAI